MILDSGSMTVFSVSIRIRPLDTQQVSVKVRGGNRLDLPLHQSHQAGVCVT
jgi:hypothetical protein